MFPLALFSEPTISPEAKLVYARILNYCHSKDTCNPSLPRLAGAVAMSEDRTGKALRELQQARLISRRRNGPGRSATIQLLWHALLAESVHGRAKERAKGESLDSADLRNQTDSLIPQNQGVDSAEPRNLDSAKSRSLFIRKEEDHFEEDQRRGSSSKQHPAVAVNDRAPEPVATNDDEPLPMTPSAAEAEGDRVSASEWTEEVFEGFCDMIATRRGQVLTERDREWFKTWLLKGTLDNALRWWIGKGTKLQPKAATGFGLFARDYESWIQSPGRLKYTEEMYLREFKRRYGLLTAEERAEEQAAAEATAKERDAKRAEARAAEERRRYYASLPGDKLREVVRALEKASAAAGEEDWQDTDLLREIRHLKSLPAFKAPLSDHELQSRRDAKRAEITAELGWLRLEAEKPDHPLTRFSVERVQALEAELAALENGAVNPAKEASVTPDPQPNTSVVPRQNDDQRTRGSDHKRASIARQIDDYRSALGLFADYPQDLAKIRSKIADLERELAALDDGDGATRADSPTPSKSNRVLPHAQCDRRKPSSPVRLHRIDERRSAARVGAILAGVSA